MILGLGVLKRILTILILQGSYFMSFDELESDHDSVTVIKKPAA